MKRLLIYAGISLMSIGLFASCEDEDFECSCATELSSSVQCHGTTQEGVQCQNNTLNCCGYCYLHTSQYTP